MLLILTFQSQLDYFPGTGQLQTVVVMSGIINANHELLFRFGAYWVVNEHRNVSTIQHENNNPPCPTFATRNIWLLTHLRDSALRRLGDISRCTLLLFRLCHCNNRQVDGSIIPYRISCNCEEKSLLCCCFQCTFRTTFTTSISPIRTLDTDPFLMHPDGPLSAGTVEQKESREIRLDSCM